MAATARAKAPRSAIPSTYGTGSEVKIGGKTVRLSPSDILGQGGEAVVYRVRVGTEERALKVFKGPSHPDYQGIPHAQAMAERRILEHQQKLSLFPKGLPSNVIAPIDLAHTPDGSLIAGYTMSLIPDSEVLHKFTERDYHESIDLNDIVAALRNLQVAVDGSHKAGLVFGDFNDLNVLVSGKSDVMIVDADSAQFGKFLCTLFTDRFVDPLICTIQQDPMDPMKTRLMMTGTHTPTTDWYAFEIMVLQSFLRVGPYSGVFKPGPKEPKVTIVERPVKGVSIFHPNVVYPKVALHYSRLPDDLLHHFDATFSKHKRDAITPQLLGSVRWTTCAGCGAKHARALCPDCAHQAPAAVKETVVKRGKVTATVYFKTSGRILYATAQSPAGDLSYVYHEGGTIRREGGRLVTAASKLDPKVRYRIHGDSTLLGRGSHVIVFNGPDMERYVVNRFRDLPMFDANRKYHYRIQDGSLVRSGSLAGTHELIGNVLPDQTFFWVGPEFGFGFYRVGEGGTVAFVFDAERPRSMNDGVQVPAIRGQLVDATCVFGAYAWFFTTVSFGGRETNTCVVVDSHGVVRATHSVEKGDASWLGSIRGKCAAGRNLFVSTDDGIVSVGVDNGMLVEQKSFPDTQPFVDSASHLLPGRGGINVIGQKEITLLRVED